METLRFRNLLCYVHALSDWRHWVCSHLHTIVDAPNSGRDLEIVKILVGCNKSTEVFIFVRGSLASRIDMAKALGLSAGKERNSDHHVICCNTCWVTVYPQSVL